MILCLKNHLKGNKVGQDIPKWSDHPKWRTFCLGINIRLFDNGLFAPETHKTNFLEPYQTPPANLLIDDLTTISCN